MLGTARGVTVTVRLSELLRERPVNRTAVNAHKKRMRDEMRAFRLAERLQVSQNRVSQLEQGDVERTQVDTLRRYVEALGGKLRVEADFRGE